MKSEFKMRISGWALVSLVPLFILFLSACTDYVQQIDDQIEEFDSKASTHNSHNTVRTDEDYSDEEDDYDATSSSGTRSSSSRRSSWDDEDLDDLLDNLDEDDDSETSYSGKSSSSRYNFYDNLYSSGNTSEQSGFDYASSGYFTDSRDRTTYKYVRIGSLYWMAENLNSMSLSYSGSGGVSIGMSCAGEDCDLYGRLYTWDAAKSVCPPDWHLPTVHEWDDLIEYAGGTSNAGYKLKSTSGWIDGGNGADSYGFDALPVGFYDETALDDFLGVATAYWSSTEDESGDKVYTFGLEYNHSDIEWLVSEKDVRLSVRCVHD